jgi:lysine 2,3-aminomutase
MLYSEEQSLGNNPPHPSQISEQVSSHNWDDWHWQLRHSIKDLETIERLLEKQFSPAHKARLEKTIARFPVSITPYYFSLIDRENFENDPVFRQSVPDPAELLISKHDLRDPLSEDKDSPVPGLTHRYPDRVLFHVSNLCSMYCRHCTRKRKVGETESIPDRKALRAGIEYIRNTPVIRDVLLSGGDPFLLADGLLDWLLGELRSIEHVEVIRIGTRTPVVLPQRITDDLVEIIAKHHPVWINTHFNHPREVTSRSAAALSKLANAGIPLGNQSVLLAGVNDCPRIYKDLVHKLVRNRVRPYYLYQCDLSEGLSHFRTPVGKGIEIIESLIGHTSGFAVPTYVIDAPGGGGKIPVMPNYLISWSTNKVVLRNYEGVIATYKEPDSYQPFFCDRNCTDCHLTLSMDNDCDESKVVGISRLLADYHRTTTLVPEGNLRLQRRDDG